MAKHRGRDRKQPKAAYTPSPGKQPKATPHDDYEAMSPAWRVSRLECADAFGAWQNLEVAKLHEIRERLAHFESMTWNEILVHSKKQNHTVPVGNLVPQAKKRLAELKLDDIDELVSLRMSARERIYGIRKQAALLLLWWDPEHAIYPVEKRHT